MTRRPGVTLIEVLVAIFIMGIGLIALLTLFPIGILRMQQALRAERSAEAGYNADKICTMQNIRNDFRVMTAVNDPYNLNVTNDDLFANPYPFNTVNGLPYLPTADPYGESYPILADPIGYFATPAGAPQDWVGGFPGYLRRRPVAFTGVGPGAIVNIYKNFTLWDDINFDATPNIAGTPQLVGKVVLRDTRFAWAYLFRRPQTRDRSVVDGTVIVFDQRSLALTGSLSLEEYVYPDVQNRAFFNPVNGTIAIDYTNVVPPPIRPGDWILDSSLNSVYTTPCACHAYFYRVTAAEELVVAGRTVVRYEVQNPIRGFKDPSQVAMTDPTFGGAFGYPGTAIVIRGIAEVFEKGPVRMP